VTTQRVRGDRYTSDGKLCELCVNVIICKWGFQKLHGNSTTLGF